MVLLRSDMYAACISASESLSGKHSLILKYFCFLKEIGLKDPSAIILGNTRMVGLHRMIFQRLCNAVCGIPGCW